MTAGYNFRCFSLSFWVGPFYYVMRATHNVGSSQKRSNNMPHKKSQLGRFYAPFPSFPEQVNKCILQKKKNGGKGESWKKKVTLLALSKDFFLKMHAKEVFEFTTDSLDRGESVAFPIFSFLPPSSSHTKRFYFFPPSLPRGEEKKRATDRCQGRRENYSCCFPPFCQQRKVLTSRQIR